MKCSTQTFFVGLVLGVLTGMYAERYSRTTMRGRKIRREVDRTIRDIYGNVEQQIGRLREKAHHTVDEAKELIDK